MYLRECSLPAGAEHKKQLERIIVLVLRKCTFLLQLLSARPGERPCSLQELPLAALLPDANRETVLGKSITPQFTPPVSTHHSHSLLNTHLTYIHRRRVKLILRAQFLDFYSDDFISKELVECQPTEAIIFRDIQLQNNKIGVCQF
jgi:hypothetical protein